MKKIIGYCRVSTANQRNEGTIIMQKQSLKAYAKKNGFNLTKLFNDDGVSGGLKDRPALSKLFTFLEDSRNKRVEAVLIYKLDRLARDLYIQEHLIKKLEKLDIALISTQEPDLASNDPMRKAFRQFSGIVSELEKAFIVMRLKNGRIRKITEKGKYTGGRIALGYKSKDQDLIVDNLKANTIRLIFKMKRHQRKGLREIARTLNAQNIPTARGGLWYAGTVKYILENKLYKGILEYSGIKAKRSDLSLFQAKNKQ